MGNKNYAYINNEMLKWARSKTPFSSVEKVEAQRSNIKAKMLSNWEKGLKLPTINQAKELASLYKVPLACFYLSEHPKNEPKPYVDRRTNRGTLYARESYELWAEIKRITDNRSLMIEHVGRDFTFPSVPIYDHRLSLDELACLIREFLGIAPPYNRKTSYKGKSFKFFRDIFEKRGIMVSQLTCVSLEEAKGLSIYYDVFPVIAVNSKDFERAKVFSLFHELAHILRRSSSLCLIDFDERSDVEEKQCDRIAAEILMPEPQFREVSKKYYDNYLNWSTECLQDIGVKFAVSSTSVARRLYELKIITQFEFQSIYNRLVTEFEKEKLSLEERKKNEELKIPYFSRYLNREGYLFPKTIISAYYEGRISYGEVCQKLNVNTKHISKIERAVMSK